MNKFHILCLWICFPFAVIAQSNSRPLNVSVFSNAASLPPGVLTKLFSEPLHPGITIGTAFRYNSHPKHALFQTAKLGYFYHRYSQHAIQLYSEAGYRYHTNVGLDFGPMLGGGYLHTIPATQVFVLNENGQYKRKNNLGSPQAMISTALELGYTPNKMAPTPIRFYLNYQFWLQFPFVRQYVPLLPGTAMHLGVSVPFSR